MEASLSIRTVGREESWFGGYSWDPGDLDSIPGSAQASLDKSFALTVPQLRVCDSSLPPGLGRGGYIQHC